MTMDTLTKILSTLLAWPVVVLVLALVFSKQLRNLADAILKRTASVKLPGNIEVSLKELEEHTQATPLPQEDQRFTDVVSKAIAKLPDRSPESIRKVLDAMLLDNRQADLHLYLKTISYQLVAWLFNHRGGAPFGIADLLVTDRIPIAYQGKAVGAYCIHSGCEKEAVAAEFKRNFWNLRRYGVIETVNENQVRVSTSTVIQSALAASMEEVCRTESERNAIQSFARRFLPGDQTEVKKLEGGSTRNEDAAANKP